MKIMNVITAMLTIILPNLSAELKAEIREAVARLEAKAAATKNPFDDLGVMLLKAMLSD